MVEKTGVVFAVTHNYTGYPLVRQAREMVLNGELGEINAIRSNYIQGWLRTRLETERPEAGDVADRPEASPASPAASATSAPTPTTSAATSPGCCPNEISCMLKTFEGGRQLDDYGVAAIRYENGALGTVTAVADQPRPRERHLHRGGRHEGGAGVAPGGAEQADRPQERRAAQGLHARRRAVPRRSRRRSRAACRAATRRRSSRRSPTSTPPPTTPWSSAPAGEKFETVNTVYPNVYDGVEGMLFITQCVASSKQNGHWLSLKHPAQRS